MIVLFLAHVLVTLLLWRKVKIMEQKYAGLSPDPEEFLDDVRA